MSRNLDNLSEDLESYHSGYYDDGTSPPVQAVDSGASSQLVVSATSTYHLLHLMPGVGSHIHSPAELVAPEPIRHPTMQPFNSSMAANPEPNLPEFVSLQETEEGFNDVRSEMVASYPTGSTLLFYRAMRQRRLPPRYQVPGAALVVPRGHVIARNRNTRPGNQRHSDSPKQSESACRLQQLFHPPHREAVPGRYDHQQLVAIEDRLHHLIQSLERTVAQLSVTLTQLRQRMEALEHHIYILGGRTTNGAFIWKIPDIARRSREARKGRIISLCSSPFYVRGYRFCVRAYLNPSSTGRGTQLSVFLVMMRREHDNLLQWPFSQSVTVSLFDRYGQQYISQSFRPDPNSSSFQRPRNEMNVASELPQFTSLLSARALLNNSLYIHVRIN